tara:strand:+ start:998 stop:1480 length:483 start_codon:yes stop_codon:yes gene_type:complete
MADAKDSLKRQNYFDLKRDEFMAMDEYLQSPISEIDLRKMNEGGVAGIENMTGPIGMANGGDAMEKILGEKGDNALLNSMKSHPFQTSMFLDMGFDKLFDLISAIPMMKEGGAVGMNEGGMHPLVVFREMHDAYKLDGGAMDFKEFFDMIQIELDKQASD